MRNVPADVANSATKEGGDGGSMTDKGEEVLPVFTHDEAPDGEHVADEIDIDDDDVYGDSMATRREFPQLD